MFEAYYIPRMEWHAEYTDEFAAWWDSLTAEEQEDIFADRRYNDHLAQLRREGKLPDG